MAFEHLKQHLAEEASDIKSFGRRLSEKKRLEEASKNVSRFLIRVDSAPLDGFDLDEKEQTYLQGVRNTGDPEMIRHAENRIKFGKMVQGNPEIVKDLGVVSPDFGERMLGITAPKERIDVTGRQAVATRKAGLEEALAGSEHKRKLTRIDFQFKRAIDLAHVKGMYDKATGTSKDPRIKFALDSVRQLKNTLTDPQKVATEDVPKIEKDINKLLKYVNDRSKGKSVELPELEFTETIPLAPVGQIDQTEVDSILGFETEEE
jgi:hypothetical protein